MAFCSDHNNTAFSVHSIPQFADMPYPLYLSLQGKYFVGYADEMTFGNGSTAWAGLINPIHSGVNLFLFVWTVTNIGTSPLKAQIFFNTSPPGHPTASEFVTPANTALCPLPNPKIELLQANNVLGEYKGGVNIIERTVEPEITVASDEDGKYIFGPGDSFIIVLSNPETPLQQGAGRVAFGWAEEKIVQTKKRRYY